MIVLDTHAWLWWMAEPVRLSRTAEKAIQQSDAVAVSAISLWEFAMLVHAGKVEAVREPPLVWLENALSKPRVQLLPLNPAVAVGSVALERFHGDPADRLIVATAQLLGSPIVTKDRRIREYPFVRTIW